MYEGAVEFPLDTVAAQSSQAGGIEWPSGSIRYDKTSTTPISRWAAYVCFRVSGLIFGWSLALIPRWHPWRVFHEGQLSLRAESLWHLPLRGLMPIGHCEPRYVTTVKLLAMLGVAWVALSLLTDLGRFDLIGFDLVRLHLATDL